MSLSSSDGLPDVPPQAIFPPPPPPHDVTTTNTPPPSLIKLPGMTPEELLRCCIESGGFETPELNERLYLHMRGFTRIGGLERYTGCQALWLDSNGIEVIEGLEPLTSLRSLYLSKNLISSIQGLNSLSLLISLVLLSLALYLPFLQKIFHFSFLHPVDILLCICASFFSIALSELILKNESNGSH